MRRNERKRKSENERNIPKVLTLLTLAGVVGYVTAEYAWPEMQTANAQSSSLDGVQVEMVQTYAMPFLEVNAVKILAITMFDQLAKEEQGDGWYDRYYRTISQDPKFDFLDIKNSSKIMTHGQTTKILENILGEEFKLLANANDAEQGISLLDFYNAYKMALDVVGRSGELEIKRLDILQTTTKDNNLQAWTTQTSNGVYAYHGLILEPLIGNNLEVIASGNDIVGILEIRQGFSKESREFSDKILRVADNYIEFEKNGKYFLEEGTSVDTTNLSAGTTVSCTTENNQITAMSIINNLPTQDMRVVITEDGKGEYFHKNIQITSKESVQITYNNQIISYAAGEIIDIDSLKLYSGEKIVIHPSYNSTYKINSITRRGINPEYVGSLEIYKEEEGYLLINEVDLENYVARVINSEMPTYFGVEACKVQAICARSFAIQEGSTAKYLKYGANVDDTTNSQVYNNLAVDEIAKEATRATAGMVLTFNGRLVKANFYSTSGGHSANYGEVWASEIFPTATPSYLTAVTQYWDAGKIYDLRDEEDAEEFFKLSADDISSYDDHAAWFRWETEFDAEELSEAINNALQNLTASQKEKVTFLNRNKKQDALIDDIGKILDIEVLNRGEGGNLISMLITAENESIEVETENLIRTILSPKEVSVKRADDQEIRDLALLPSAFCTFDIEYEDGAIKSLNIYGGGSGHGVGMSQEGVRGMVNRGYTYDEILKHYYQGIEIGSIEE